MYRAQPSYVVERDGNIVRVDFGREPDPPAPKFPGAGALHEAPMSVAEVELRVSPYAEGHYERQRHSAFKR